MVDVTHPIWVAKFWSRVKVESDFQCWEWQGAKTVNGYGRHGFDRAHRRAYALIKGTIPNGALVRHRCDNKLCCNPAHLEIGSHDDNMADAVDRARMARGERNANAKLTSEEVALIRENPNHLKQSELARMFAVSESTISYVRNRKRRIYEEAE